MCTVLVDIFETIPELGEEPNSPIATVVEQLKAVFSACFTTFFPQWRERAYVLMTLLAFQRLPLPNAEVCVRA